MEECFTIKWYVMRDLKRRNSLMPAYRYLSDQGFEVFTPMKWNIYIKSGVRIRKEEPVIADLLFVHSSKESLDAVVFKTPTLQYRFRQGFSVNDPMVVRDKEMDIFMRAVSVSKDTRYYRPDEIRPEMIGRGISVIGGPLDGYSGKLLSLKGSRKKRLLVELPDFLTAAVEVQPEFIQFL